MPETYYTNSSDEIIVDSSDRPLDCAGCPCSSHETDCEGVRVDDAMVFAATFVTAGGDIFITGHLTWSATAVGGVSEGWRFVGDQTVCSDSPSLAVREIVFWCVSGTWKMSLVVLFNGVQDTFQTDGGSLTALSLTSASNPRSYSTRTVGDNAISSCGTTGYLKVDVAVRLVA